MDIVSKLMKELKENPAGFGDDGYERLQEALWDGSDPGALKQALKDPSDFSGDLLWIITELDEVAPFASNARQYLVAPDRGTAACAVEIMLRGSQCGDGLRQVFERLNEGYDTDIAEHAVRTLWGAGITRLIAVLELVGYEWSGALAQKLALSMEPFCRDEFEALIEGLVVGKIRDRQVVGLTLASLVWQQDSTYVSFFLDSDEAWIRSHGEYLKSLGEKKKHIE